MRFVCAWSALVCALALAYVTVGINSYLAIIIFIFAAVFALWKIKIKFTREFSAPLLCATLIDAAMFVYVWHARTDAPMRTPWEQISAPIVCVGFFCSTLFLVYGLRSARAALTWIALITHSALAYGIALFTFRYGFGYDPLIHQAAENYVVAHGKILPLQPFYIGQYALVAALHFITHIPVEMIDRVLVPALATFTIPPIVYVAARYGYELAERESLLAPLVLTMLPLSELTFTTPHNLTIVYTIWLLALLPLGLRTRLGSFTLLLLCGAITVTHPLLGVPLCIATIGAWRRTKLAAVISGVLIAASLVMMLSLYRSRHGSHFFTQFNFTNFISLWQIHALSIISGLLFLCSLYALLKNKTFPLRWTLASLTAGIILGIFLISTVISTPNIAAEQQNEFALRLKYIVPLLLLPCLFGLLKKNTATYILCAAIASTSLFVSFPKRGYSISGSDIDAINTIRATTGSEQFAILSNQLVAQAALREFGFETVFTMRDGTKFHPSAIAINEPMYPFAQKMFTQSIERADIDTLKIALNGPVFIIVDSYWDRHDVMIQEANAAEPLHSTKFPHATLFEY